jgi:hypothetical protein
MVSARVVASASRADGVIDAGQHGGFHHPFRPEQRFRIAVKRVVETVPDRQCAGDTVGGHLGFREILRQSTAGQRSHRVVGQADPAGDSAMRVQLIGGPPHHADRHDDDLLQRLLSDVFLLGDRELEEADEMAGVSTAGLNGPMRRPASVPAETWRAPPTGPPDP